jgi:hypothetical protein
MVARWHKELLAKALLLGASPALAAPADCLKGLQEIALDSLLPTRVHNQRDQGMCYAYAWSLLADAALRLLRLLMSINE